MDSVNFGVAQSRKRIFIYGTKKGKVSLDEINYKNAVLADVLEAGLPTLNTNFVQKLFENFSIQDLYGKSIKDKRGGNNNIHSWDIGIKGKVSDDQKLLLSQLFKERRRKIYAEQIGIDWMDGMSLTYEQINSFFKPNLFSKKANLKKMLDDLVKKGYLKFEHPKKLVKEETETGIKSYRTPDETKEKGFNIVTGKLSFEFNKILDPNDIAPTLVATDVSRLAVPDGNGLRRLTIREGLRLFGYPEWYEIPVKKNEAFDLLGNTVAVPVAEYVAMGLARYWKRNGAIQVRANANRKMIKVGEHNSIVFSELY